MKRAKGVDHARALEVTLAAQVGRRRAKNFLDARGTADKFAVTGEQQGSGAAYVWRGHARAVHAFRFAEGNGADDLLSRCDEIGFEPAIAGWTTAGKVTHAVEMRTVAMRCADSDHALSVSRIGDADALITFLRSAGGHELKITIVAGGCDHDNSRAHESICFFANRSAAAGEVGNVMFDRKTEIDALATAVTAPGTNVYIIGALARDVW